jgi:hypothetical protein
MGLIGSGSRGRGVAATFLRNHGDVEYVAACDVYKVRLEQGIQQLAELREGTMSHGAKAMLAVMAVREGRSFKWMTPP